MRSARKPVLFNLLVLLFVASLFCLSYPLAVWLRAPVVVVILGLGVALLTTLKVLGRLLA